MSALKISLSTGTDASRWNAFVDTCPGARIYHRAEWQNLVRQVFGHEGSYLQATDAQGNIQGVLPMITMESLLFGRFCISLPYFNYGGAVAVSEAVEQQLMRQAREFVVADKLDFIEFRDDKPREGWPVRTDKVSMILPLEKEPERMFKQFKAKLRSQVRRPMRENVEVVFGGPEYLDDFYLAFTTNMRDLGTPPYSKKFFAAILSTFPDNAYLAIVRKGREVAGGAFLLGYKDTLEIPWASTIRKFNPIGVNMLMYWEVIRSAIEKGYAYFDFGRCSRDAGTYRFKKQWGSREHPLYWHYDLLRQESLPQINPDNAKYRLFIETWKKLPLPLTRLLGPSIVKNIP